MILVTGGLGYIGSHACVALTQAGERLVVLDNLSNAKRSVLERLRELCPDAILDFCEADVRDRGALARVFAAHRVEAVLHFAGLKSVAESVARPLLYYDNNVGGSLALVEAMLAAGVERIVFSSSATVYGPPLSLPHREDHPTAPHNPYGRAKRMVEELLADVARAQPGFRYVALRYFNPIGAHPSGRIGEDPRGEPNNLLPFVTQVAVGRRARLRIHGDDYPTADGTGVRDYLHVMDLAEGHLAALARLRAGGGSLVANLGTGRGHSVREVLAAFERTTGVRVPFEVGPRRAGDLPACWADPSLAERELGWRARRTLEEACRDAWRWQCDNPAGYPD